MPSPRRPLDDGPSAPARAGIVLCLSGDGGGVWEELVLRLWSAGPRPVALDLSAVTGLTPSAIRAVVRTAAGARHRGVGLELRAVPPAAAGLLRGVHLGHLVTPHGDVEAPEPPPVGDGPRSWAGLCRVATTAQGAVSADQLEAALHRSAFGDRRLEQALTDLAGAGPSLLTLLRAGFITLEPDVDVRGGGWWAEVEWADLLDALARGSSWATPGQAARVRDAAFASGQLDAALAVVS